MQPEEDKMLCKHVWCELYSGMGTDRNNPRIGLASFFCEKCLDIRTKAYSQERYYISNEFLRDYENQEDSDGVKS